LEKRPSKYKAKNDKHQVDHHFQVGDQVWIYISKECLKGEGKKTQPNQVWSVDVENLKLYEPPMIMDQDENVQVLYVDEFSLEYLDVLREDDIIDRKVRTSRRVYVEYLHVGLKGMHPSKE
jgi:hypothetical protein